MTSAAALLHYIYVVRVQKATCGFNIATVNAFVKEILTIAIKN